MKSVDVSHIMCYTSLVIDFCANPFREIQSETPVCGIGSALHTLLSLYEVPAVSLRPVSDIPLVFILENL